jgi:NTE family protein
LQLLVGGGSHTAFTSGVLQRIMKEKDKDFEIVAISGTSGGALCASLLWYALTGGCEGNGKTDDLAIDLLDKYWKANSVQTPVELFSNNLMMQMTDLTEKFNLPSTEFNPNKFAEMMGGKDLGKETFKKLLCEFIKFDKIDEIVDKFKATNKKNPIKLFLGAVDVLAGNFHLFSHEDLAKQGGKYGAEAIIASACIPTLFTPVELNGTGYWDGLFSENPPVVCLAKEIIDELWIIQINPKTYTHVPKLTADINDRRNELSGNLSLEMALDGIKFINELLAKNAFTAE